MSAVPVIVIGLAGCGRDVQRHGKGAPSQPTTAVGLPDAEVGPRLAPDPPPLDPAIEEACPPGPTVPAPATVAGRRITGDLSASDAWWTAAGERGPDTIIGWGGHLGDIDGDGLLDIVAGTAEVPAEADVYLGPFVPGEWVESEVMTYRYDPVQYTGGSFLLDLEGDGRSEVALKVDACCVWIFDGARETGTLDPHLLEPRITVEPANTSGQAGIHASADFTGDGTRDVWLGGMNASYNLLTLDYYVDLRLLAGPLPAFVDVKTPIEALYEIDETTGTTVGGVDQDNVGVGDFDGDGAVDLAFGLWGDVSTGYGEVVFVLDPPHVSAPLPDVVSARLVGEGSPGQVATHTGVRTVPDMNGDGYDEVAFGAGYPAGMNGALYLQYGPPPTGEVPVDCVSTVFDSPGPNGGISSVRVGDVDGDGIVDLVADRMDDVVTAVEAQIWYGPVATGTFDIFDADAHAIGQLIGVGDMDGDGADDLVSSTPTAFDNGEIYIYRGGFE